MTAEVVFLVESIDHSGRPYTLCDKLKAISSEWTEHYNTENIDTYISCTGDKIKFQPYSSIDSLDSNKKYYYFISLDHFNFDFSVYLQLLGKSKLKRLHENNVSLYFAHDLETIPPIEYTFFIKQLEWLYVLFGAHSDVNNNIIFSTASMINHHHRNFIDQYFYKRFKFIHSPLTLKYALNELNKTYPSADNISWLNTKPKLKQFTCLNRASRFHRTLFLHGLRACNLMEEGYISYASESVSSPDIIMSDTDYAKIIKNDMLRPMPSMKLDQYNNDRNRPTDFPAFPDQQWSSYYDVVSETAVQYNFTDQIDYTVLTEKTTKSLLSMRPFMINGGPFCLRYLKSIGFKTFDHIFDESYDETEDLLERQRLMIKNISLYKNKYDELRLKVESSKDILAFNRNHLLSMNFEQLLINELMSVS